MAIPWTSRALSPEFLKSLKNGVLTPLLDRVKEDNTLELEFRGNDRAANIYYRGGSIVKIKEKKRGFEVIFDEGYFRSPLGTSLRKRAACVRKIDSLESCRKLVAALPLMKQAMDVHFTMNHGDEREFQQLVVKENNFSSLGVSTDYFLCDIEYTNDHISRTNSRTRLDLVGAHWPGDKVARKRAASARLVIFEMKYGVGSYTGRSGIVGHLKSLARFLADSDFVTGIKEEMTQVVGQKVELGLFPHMDFMGRFGFSEDTPEYVLILANHKPRSPLLLRELQEVPSDYPVTIKIGVSTFAGYGLFEQSIFPRDAFLRQFQEQVFTGSKRHDDSHPSR